MKKLFSERHGLAQPRVKESLDQAIREALITLVHSRIDEEWFGQAFPDACPDGYGNAGTDRSKMKAMMKGYGLLWPVDGFDADTWTSDTHVFDLLEFSYECIALPEPGNFHSFFAHHHYSYDQDAGRARFTADVNRLFERNGIAFELKDGEIVRLAPTVLHEELAHYVFQTGDTALDKLLEVARDKFLKRSAQERQESLEKLWDAWERLKTIEPGADKNNGIRGLLDKAAAGPLRDRLEQEAKELTEIGNKFMIRHMETDKVAIEHSVHVDYLFHRMFAMIRLLLKESDRGG
ncbi:AbiJ-NTD4 domain-containing protein [Caballeronia sp. GaOx3]|uniref:AbiJ-NTD4 domain-containing protein n=1 Tax=Caballeronia sp. GaOx3 TaxID=2921740 RepID=UPI002028B4C0|nr:hypothetical protein [Caballeronia sp. GaOx3]